MKPYLHIVLATKQPEKAGPIIDSVLNQLEARGNGKLHVLNDSGKDVIWYEGGNVWLHNMPGAPNGYWGHVARNMWHEMQVMKQHEGNALVWHIDDDDIIAHDALDIIDHYADVTRLTLFRYYHREHKRLYWNNQFSYINNVGTPCGVFPLLPDLPKFGLFRGGDGEFYQELSKQLPVKWVDKTIYIV